MSSKEVITGNNGEWSEQYVMYYLLVNKVLRGSNRRLEQSGVDMPLINIEREEDGSVLQYFPGQIVRIIRNGSLIAEVGESDFVKHTEYLKTALMTKEGTEKSSNGAFAIPVVEAFMKKIYCSKLKSDSDNKRDITLELHDVMTGFNAVEGFSIKSYLGADPTLINPSAATMFRYEVVGCTDEIRDKVNSISGKNAYIERVQEIFRQKCRLDFVKLENDQFGKNLCMLDSNLIPILQDMLIRVFAGQCISVRRFADWYDEHDPLELKIPRYYTYKIKQLLSAYALGMVSAYPWEGDEDANGGFIVVKPMGDVVCFFIYDRKELYEYLLDCTKFDRPSSSKYGDYMDIFEEDGKFYLDLCLQIRFVEPGHKFQKGKYEHQMFK